MGKFDCFELEHCSVLTLMKTPPLLHRGAALPVWLLPALALPASTSQTVIAQRK